MRGSKPKSNDDNSVFSSTSRTSYKPIDVLPILKQERLEYAKNKGKARKPAEWWGHQTEHSPTSIYRDSFKSNNFQEWIKKVETLPVAGNKSGKIPDVSHTYEQRSEEATTEKKSPLVSWAQYRVRKPASDSSGLGYDIVTGESEKLGVPIAYYLT
ncbi:hypothetical protein HDU85_004514 [Gaertneriomyces sp. JEL0708]|nr:hypothetical protein HDU85_004514 [Gaertneriomyces sp. JEL0708]